MSDLVAIAFDTPQEADAVLTDLKRMQKEYLVDLADAVVVIRQPDGKINMKQSIDTVGVGAASGGLSGALWGMLVGLFFLNPLVGFAIGGLVDAGKRRACRQAHRLRHRRQIHPLARRHAAAGQFGAVRPFAQGAARQSARGAEALQGEVINTNVSFAGTGKPTSPGFVGRGRDGLSWPILLCAGLRCGARVARWKTCAIR